MLTFEMTDDHSMVVAVIEGSQGPWLNRLCRGDFKSFAFAELVASSANALGDGETYIATDAGAHCHPRYDVVRVPKVGDPVSYAFNGDSTPCGTVYSVSGGPLYRVINTVTKDGAGSQFKMTFTRKKLTGSWVRNATWSLIAGHHYERNPHL